MKLKSSRASKSLAVKGAELAMATPQVVAHRMARMVLAGPNPSPRDRQEFSQMVAEKQVAFAQSWREMAVHAMHLNQAFSATLLKSLYKPSMGQNMAVGLAMGRATGAGLSVLEKGLAPIHRKAVANSKRLARTKLR